MPRPLPKHQAVKIKHGKDPEVQEVNIASNVIGMSKFENTL